MEREMTPKVVFDNTIFSCTAGSHAYRTNTSESDTDVRGVCITPFKEFYLLPWKSFEQYAPRDKDWVIYDLRKFVALAAACNPNIIELLWIPDELVHFKTSFGESLFGMRDLFLSRKARHTFTGYARSQLNRLKNHKRWIDNPPSKPDRTTMGLPIDHKVVSPDNLDAARALGAKAFTPETWELIRKELAYATAKREYDMYKSWRRNRNPKRFEMEQKFGYDGKHAMHLVRLLRMGLEIVKDGRVVVRRPDAEELLGIRNGEWPFDQLMEYADKMDGLIVESEATSPLPWGPDMELISDWLCESIETYLARK